MARRRQAVTIKHVAADAGVSLQTVSRVINKEPNVRPAMKQRVEASIEKLGYVPSIAAQRMGGSRSYLIMALNDRERTIADWRERQGTDWVDQMMYGGMLTCADHGYRMIVELVDTHSDNIERALSGALASLQPDGVILTPPHSANDHVLRLLDEHHINFARIGSVKPGPGITLTMDDERAARLATEHLIGLGHRRIGFISGSDDYELSSFRVDGWRTTMRAAGLEDDTMLAHGDFSFESGREGAIRLLDAERPATAIIASNDRMSLAVMDVARARGMNIPRDLSLISFDDTPITRFTHPPLTAVQQPIAKTTARAVELIIGALAGKEPPAMPVVVRAELVKRGSTMPPADVEG